MRQLAHLAAAAAMVAGVVLLPAPAAAETAEACHASINQYRASAGLDKASATSIPALAKAAAWPAGHHSSHGGLGNERRSASAPMGDCNSTQGARPNPRSLG